MTLTAGEQLTTIDAENQNDDLSFLIDEVIKLTDDDEENDDIDVSESLSDGFKEYLKANIEVAKSLKNAISALPETKRNNEGIKKVEEFLKEIIPSGNDVVSDEGSSDATNTDNIVFTEAQLEQSEAFNKMKELILLGKYEDFSEISKKELKAIQSFISDSTNKQAVFDTYFSMKYEHPLDSTASIGRKDSKRYNAIKQSFEECCNTNNQEYINYELEKVLSNYSMRFVKDILKIENWDGNDLTPELPQVEEFQKGYLFDGKQFTDKFNAENQERKNSNKKMINDMPFDLSNIEGLIIQEDKLMLNDQELTKENLYEELNLLAIVKKRLDTTFDTYYVTDDEVKESFTEEKLQGIYNALKTGKEDEISAAIEALKPGNLNSDDDMKYFSGLKKENIIAAFNKALENVGQDQQNINLLNNLKKGLSSTWENNKNNEAYKAIVEVQSALGIKNPDGKFGRNTYNEFIEHFDIYSKPKEIKAEEINVTIYSSLTKEDVVNVFNASLKKVENEEEANILLKLYDCLKSGKGDDVKSFQESLTGKEGDGKLGKTTLQTLMRKFSINNVTLSVDVKRDPDPEIEEDEYVGKCFKNFEEVKSKIILTYTPMQGREIPQLSSVPTGGLYTGTSYTTGSFMETPLNREANKIIFDENYIRKDPSEKYNPWIEIGDKIYNINFEGMLEEIREGSNDYNYAWEYQGKLCLGKPNGEAMVFERDNFSPFNNTLITFHNRKMVKGAPQHRIDHH